MNVAITMLFVCRDERHESSLKSKLTNWTESSQIRGYPSLSDLLMIEISYHFSHCKISNISTFTIFCGHRDTFGKLARYYRFVTCKKHLFMPLTLLLHSLAGEETGLYFADSAPITVCHHKHSNNHKVFDGLAPRGQAIMGWF